MPLQYFWQANNVAKRLEVFVLLRYDQQKLNSQIYANGHLQL